MRVAAWQAPIGLGGGADRLLALEGAARAAAAAGACSLVAPEFALSGPPGPTEPGSPSDGPEARALAEIARSAGIAIAAGYLEACTGRLYSAALVVDRNGRALANYRRTHLRPAERERLSAGAWLSIVPLGERRCGLVVGYDLRFPEVARALVLAGADLLLCLGSRPGESEATLGPLAAARAIENGVPLVLAAEAEAGTAPARILGPRGELLAFGGAGPGTIVADLPLALPNAAGLTDRRPRLYRQLVAEEP